MSLVIDVERATKRQTKYDPNVVYWIYHADGDFQMPKEVGKEKNAQMLTGVCFSNFLRSVAQNKARGKSTNTIAYKPHVNRFGNHLTETEINRWIEWCVQWKLLPSYVNVAHLKESHFSLRFGDISPSLIYVYLCNLRHYEEWPDVIRISLYLADEMGVNPYLALAFAANIGCGTTVHNYLDFGIQWSYDKPTPPNPTVSLAHAIAMKWYIENPQKYDSRTCYDGGEFSAPAFTCWPTISTIVSSLVTVQVPGCDLDHPAVVAAMESNAANVVKEHVEEYKKQAAKKAA